MNIIGMLDVPSTGKYIFNNKEVSTKTEGELSSVRGRNIGFVFQSYNLIPRMSVLKQVMLPLAYARVSKKMREIRAMEALAKV
jgi:putative ABC transport system ATP-binding protein